MLDSDASSPRGSAQEQLAEYGDAFGIDGTTSKAVVTQTLDSATGGSVVRAEQVVDGVPVFGGQVVMSLDEDQGVVSVASATTDATQVPLPVVSEARAGQHGAAPSSRRTTTCRARRPDRDSVRAAGSTTRRSCTPPTRSGPARSGSSRSPTAPTSARPCWSGPVAARSPCTSTTLPDDQPPGLRQHAASPPDQQHGRCRSARSPPASEGQPTSAVTDVNEAYDNLGEASVAYAELAGIDLTTSSARRERHRRPCSPPCAGATRDAARAPTRTPSGTARRWCSAPGTPVPTTWWATSSPTATSSARPDCSTLHQSRRHQRVGGGHDRRDRRPPQRVRQRLRRGTSVRTSRVARSAT